MPEMAMRNIRHVGYQCVQTAWHDREIVAIAYSCEVQLDDGAWVTRWFVKSIPDDGTRELLEREPRTQYVVRGM